MNRLKVLVFPSRSCPCCRYPSQGSMSMRTDHIWRKDKRYASFEELISFLEFKSPSAASIVTQSLPSLLARTFPHISDLLSLWQKILIKPTTPWKPSLLEQSLPAVLHSSEWKQVKWFGAFFRLCPPKCITQTKEMCLGEMRNGPKLTWTKPCQV